MGIDAISSLSSIIEPEHHGTIELHTPLGEKPEEVIRRAAKPCLVVTPSYELALTIGKEIPNATVRLDSETTTEAAQRVGPDGVLIAAGAWAGLDTSIVWASIVVPKIPFPVPIVIDKRIESHYLDIRNVATRRMRQVIGRGLRTPDAKCQVYILDCRYKDLGAFVPKRFQGSWVEGGIQVKIQAEAKRMRGYRKKALEHYGSRCFVCSFEPIAPRQIHIHHLEQITEGVRTTTLEDLRPLCANCHELAHSESPPITIDRLKAMVGP
jgi:5-methylcytosine-specific restriction endonuclease McrA